MLPEIDATPQLMTDLDWSTFGLVHFKKDAPDPPDPMAVGAAQTDTNIKTAQEQARLAMTGQQTPWGSVQYVKDPTSPSGFRAITQLSPEQQALLGQSQDLTAQIGGVTGEQVGRVGDVMATPFDLNAGRATELTDIQRTFMDPQWDQMGQELESQLLNRGIRPGSESYDREKRRFSDERTRAYNRMFLDSFNTANQAALQERNLPLTDLAAISGARGTPMPGQFPTAQTPTPGVAPTDIVGPTMQNYAAQVSQNNAQMGGLYGLGSAALGGWASAGFPGVTAALGFLSDRRVKTNVVRIGTDRRGWGIYQFKYIEAVGAPGMHIGFMVDEVEKTRPDAITTHTSGFKMINYAALGDPEPMLEVA